MLGKRLLNFVDPYMVVSAQKSGKKEIQEKKCFWSCDFDKGQIHTRQ